LIFHKEVTAVTVDEISALISGYPDSHFTNANAGIRDSFVKSLEAIDSNIDLFHNEDDPLFMAELDQEIQNGINELIAKTDGCIPPESEDPDANDWLAECQAQTEIHFKLNELLTSY